MKMRKLVLLLSCVIASTILAQVPFDPAPASAEASKEETPASELRVFTNADGTGTANVLARWIDSDTLGDSVVQQVGGAVGVGPIPSVHVVRALTVDPGASTNGGLRVYRTGAANFPYFDVLLNTNATPYASLQVGDSIIWRTLSLNPSGGNVGVGTTSPVHRFDVHAIPLLNGDTRELMGIYDTSAFAAGVGGGLVFGGKFSSAGTIAQQFASIEGFKENATDSDFAGALSFNTRLNGGQPAERMRIDSKGYVGIGTTAPGAPLHLGGTPTQDIFVSMGGNVVTGPVFNMGYSGSSFGRSSVFFNVRPDALATAPNPSLRFMTADVLRMIITNTGQVGIGTTSPTPGTTLDVVGNANFSGTVTGGNIQAKYQDLAEWVPSRDDLAPGTVVVLDPAAGNGILASTTAYDTTVAGVVSAQPGILLGEAGADKEQIATTGRVRVKVDASRGPIAVGDLLVTSDKPGFAMRSAPLDLGGIAIHRPGTIVGKALETLASGEGEILVLLSLQ